VASAIRQGCVTMATGRLAPPSGAVTRTVGRAAVLGFVVAGAIAAMVLGMRGVRVVRCAAIDQPVIEVAADRRIGDVGLNHGDTDAGEVPGAVRLATRAPIGAIRPDRVQHQSAPSMSVAGVMLRHLAIVAEHHRHDRRDDPGHRLPRLAKRSPAAAV
jgi:hypothetical protein